MPSAHVVPQREQLKLFADETVAGGASQEPLVVVPPAERARPEPDREPVLEPAPIPDETQVLSTQ